jgi:hypothetical protein
MTIKSGILTGKAQALGNGGDDLSRDSLAAHAEEQQSHKPGYQPSAYPPADRSGHFMAGAQSSQDGSAQPSGASTALISALAVRRPQSPDKLTGSATQGAENLSWTASQSPAPDAGDQ